MDRLADLWSWLEATSFAAAVRESLWLYPTLESAHVVGLALLVGATAVLDARLVGFARAVSVRRLARLTIPWAILGFLIVATSGAAIFTADAVRMAGSGVFRLKMVLVVVAGVNALVFHLGPWCSLERWDTSTAPPITARLLGASSLLVWIGVITACRLIAYL